MQEIDIGMTGSYEIDIDADLDLIRIPENAQYQGMVTYGYYNDAQNVFNEVQKVDIADYLGQQYIGSQSNIVDQINNVKFALLKFYYLHFEKRYIENYNASVTDPFPLYLEHLDKLNVNGVNVPGIEEVDNALVRRDLIVEPTNPEELIVSSRYYFIDMSDKTLVPARGTTYDENRTYYILKPIKRYYDLNKKSTVIIDQDSYDRIKLFMEKTGYPTSNLLSNLEILSYNISVDGHILNLDEIEQFDIDEVILFDSIELDNGTVLECGYQLQEKTYSVEDLPEVANNIAVINGTAIRLQDTYNQDMYYLSLDYFYKLRDGEISEEEYNNNTLQARKELPQVYKAYMELVEQEKLIWEENELYE